MNATMNRAKRLRAFLYKRCPRCGGDLLIERDEDARGTRRAVEYGCILCGRRAALETFIQQRRREKVEAA